MDVALLSVGVLVTGALGTNKHPLKNKINASIAVGIRKRTDIVYIVVSVLPVALCEGVAGGGSEVTVAPRLPVACRCR